MTAFCTQCGSLVRVVVDFRIIRGGTLNPQATAARQSGTQSSPSVESPGARTIMHSREKHSSFALIRLVALFGIGALGTTATAFTAHHMPKSQVFALHQNGRSGVALFAGFQANTAHDPRHSGRDACTLVTKDEVGSAIGTPIVSSENDRGDRSKCIYRGAPGTYKIVEIEVKWTGGSQDIQAARMTSRALGDFAKVADVPGIGDDAVMMPMNSGLIVRKGDTSITVDMRLAPKDVNISKAIAAKALSRL